MYEFDSVSVSSFEAASLAPALTEKAADGWSVTAIVTAGSDVVAYLQRALASETDDTTETTVGTTETDSTDSDAAADPAALIVAAAAEPIETTTTTAATAVEPVETSAPTSSSQPSSTSAVDTSTGWASGTAATTGGWNGQSTSDTTSTWGGSSQQAPATQPAVTPQVPAGWYADPAGRFELRYWDGGSWTEHVSRAGQQYTDPPVA